MNADTIVLEGALATLVEFMDAHPEAGIAGSPVPLADGEVQSSPFRFPGVLSELDRGMRLGPVSRALSRWAVAPPAPDSECRADWLSGASMILRGSMLDQVGLLDEGLYTYFDDIDICLRARRAGWQVWYVPTSRIIHLEGASTQVGSRIAKRRPAYWYQARRRFLLKSHGALYTSLMDATFILGYATWRLRRLIQRKPDDDPPSTLADSIRHSVFCTGFRVTEVPNPAMQPATTPQ
ncbi:glycosyltransferase family 2 protein [Aquisphaera giovannonii]|uniref:glycosyltransferase family 2 protein n=1 Tax=Aquisphaera giovannonii TaxID=406548 RepID=UPI001FE8B084|nr:glycosyltransferase family 2 protein [Aquisphaera giovannonii]